MKDLLTRYLQKKQDFRREQAIMGATSGGLFIDGDKAYRIVFKEGSFFRKGKWVRVYE